MDPEQPPTSITVFDREDSPRAQRWAHHELMQRLHSHPEREKLAESLEQLELLDRHRNRLARLESKRLESLTPFQRWVDRGIVAPLAKCIAWLTDKLLA